MEVTNYLLSGMILQVLSDVCFLEMAVKMRVKKKLEASGAWSFLKFVKISYLRESIH